MNFHLNTGDIYAIITALCWSGAVILFKVSTRSLGSMEMNLLKNTIGIIGFAAVLMIPGNGFPEFTSREIILLMLSGTLGIAGGDLLFLASLRRMGAGLNAIVSTAYSPVIVILAFLMYNETISIYSYAGGTLIILGIIVGSYRNIESADGKTLSMGILFGIGAQIMTGVSILMIKPVMDNHPVVPIALVRFGTSVLLGAVFIGMTRGTDRLVSVYRTGLTHLPLIAGSFFGTFLSVIFWLAGFKYTMAGRAAIYNQLSTVLIILMAAIFLREPMSPRKWFAVILAFSGGLIVAIV